MDTLEKEFSNTSRFSAEGKSVNILRAKTVASNKLDVMTSKQFNRLTLLTAAITAGTLLHVLMISIACNTVWLGPITTNGTNGETLITSECKAPKSYMIPLFVLDLVARSGLIVLSIVFTVRIIRTNVPRSIEQIWTVVMVVMTAWSYNPSKTLFILHDRVIYAKNKKMWWLTNYPWFFQFITYTRVINMFLSSVGQLFYVWASAHYFGVLDDKDRPSNLRFYGPKLLILGIYNVYRIVLGGPLKVSPSKLPASTGIAMIANFRALKVFEVDVFLKTMVLVVIELIILIAIMRRMVITAKVLRHAQYVKYRGKQIGFRFFVMSNVIAYSLFLFADTTILLLVPRWPEIRARLFAYANFSSIFYNVMYGSIPRLLNYATTAITAYVNLPADSVGFMGWFRGTDKNEVEEKEPITPQLLTNKGDFNVNHMSTCLNFDLIVEMFNISDAAYMCKANEVKSQRATDFVKYQGIKMELEIFNDQNETFLIVLSSETQIIIGFKGTTSLENMKTDLKVKMTPIAKALPSKSTTSHKVLLSMDWKNAKIHEGFAKAYSSVSEQLFEIISNLQRENPRPVYLTGHSLGGSLATVASFDLVLSLNLANVYVLTFGSPRCGNIFWGRCYDQVVKAHWRVAMRSDLITTLPSAGYSHVGKRVALNTSGDMFLDPNAIETMLWSPACVNLSDHGKGAYKDALTSFATKYLSDFTPEFIDKDGTATDCPTPSFQTFDTIKWGSDDASALGNISHQ